MHFVFQPMDEASARVIFTWRYNAPYDIYNADAGEADAFVQALLDPRNGYYIITDAHGALVGYCCFGPDGQVGGGDYTAGALDVGLGMRPHLTGQGRGLAFFSAILDFGRRTFAPQAFRVTVAAFNRRALRVYEKAGFRATQAFGRDGDGLPFVVLVLQEPATSLNREGAKDAKKQE